MTCPPTFSTRNCGINVRFLNPDVVGIIPFDGGPFFFLGGGGGGAICPEVVCLLVAAIRNQTIPEKWGGGKTYY